MKKLLLITCTFLVFISGISTLQAQTTVNLAQQCDCEVKKPGTEVTAGATTPAGTNTGDLLIDASGDIFYWDGDSWEVPTTSSSGIQAAGTEVTAGATTPAGTNTGDLLIDASGDIFYWDGDSWEVSSTGGSTPWNNPDGTPANQSSTDINYMGGKVGIGTTTPTTDFSVIGGIDNTFNIVSTRNIAGNLFHQVVNESSDASAYAGHILGNDQNPDAANIYLGSSNASTWAGPNSLNISNNLNAPTSFWTNGAERMRITADGKVGVGTTDPTNTLHVVGFPVFQRSGNTANPERLILRKSNGTATSPTAVNDGDGIGAIAFGTYNGTNWTGSSSINIPALIQTNAVGNHTTSNIGANISFRTTAENTTSSVARMTIMHNGRVGIGTENPITNLQLMGGLAVTPTNSTLPSLAGLTSTLPQPVFIINNGAAFSHVPTNVYNMILSKNSQVSGTSDYILFKPGSNATIGRIRTTNGTTISYVTTSDKRLKENIVNNSNGLNKVMDIRVVDYNFIHAKNKVVETGFLAQELYEIFPQAVSVGGEDVIEDPWAVDYGKVTPILVKAIQEQQAQIEALNTQVDQLNAQVETMQELRAELDAIKAMLNTNASSQTGEE